MPTSELDILVALFKSSPWIALVVVVVRYAPGWVKSISQWVDKWGERLLADREAAEKRFLEELSIVEQRCMVYSEKTITMILSNQTTQMNVVMDYIRMLERRLDYTMGMDKKEGSGGA